MKKGTKQAVCIVLSLVMALSSFWTTPTVSDAKAKLAKTKLTMTVGDKTKITIKKAVDKAKYTFVSSDKKKASVSSKGKITAKKAGKVTITVYEKKKKAKKKTKVGKIKVTIKAKSNSDKKKSEAPAVSAPAASAPAASAPVGSPAASAPAASASAAPTASVKPSRSPKPSPTPFDEDPEFNNLPNGYTAQKEANAGTLERLDFETKVYYKKDTPDDQKPKVERHAMIVLPKDYTKSKKYPVIYLLHGFSDSPEFMVGDGGTNKGNGDQYVVWNAIANGDCREAIVVVPSVCCNEDGKSAFDANMNEFTIAFDYSIKEITGVLMPLVNKKYSTLTDRENTVVCGFSMGGRESFNIGLRRQDLFGAIGAFNPAPGAFGGGDMLTEAEVKIEDAYKDSTYIQITAGSDDTTVQNNPFEYHQLLDRRGIKHSYYMTKGGDPGGTGNGGHWKTVYQHGLYNFVKRALPVK